MDNLPKHSERGNMMIILVVALLLLAALVFFLLGKNNVFSGLTDLRSSNGKEIKEEGTASSKMKVSPVEKEADLSSLSIPLYTGISWKQTTEVPNLLKDVIVISDNTTNASANIHLDGTVWVYKKDTVKTIEEFNADSTWGNIVDYYQSEGEKQGWSYSKTVGNYTISGMNADGDGSSAQGWVKVNGDNVQAIMLLSTTTFASGEFPIDATCPCSQTYYVFESSEVPLDALTKQITGL